MNFPILSHIFHNLRDLMLGEKSEKKQILVETMYGNYFSIERDVITQQLLDYGAHTRNELAMLLSFIREGDCVIDVGAHIGTFCIPIARKVERRGKCFVFEPSHDNFAILEKNIELNGLTEIISAEQLLVTDRAGNYKWKRLADNSGATQFFRSEDDRYSSSVKCVSLDEWYEAKKIGRRIDVIKIDVEGMELSVLKSARRIIERYKPVIYCEVSRQQFERHGASIWELEDFLVRCGYIFFRNSAIRNSASDTYEVSSIRSLPKEGDFFDVLAIHKLSDRLVGTQKMIVGCVAENNNKYIGQALRLLQSVRWFGGRLNGARFIVCVIDDVDPVYKKMLTLEGADVRVIPRFSSKHSQSNKLGFLQLKEVKEYDRVMLLDCDTIVVQDPTGYILQGDFLGKIADASTVTHQIFKNLFEEFDIPMPARNYKCTVTGDLTIPYFNTGVLIFSKQALHTLVPKWISLNRELIAKIELLGEHQNFCEQASLSLALVACGTKFKTLHNAMNFPMHFTDIRTYSDLTKVDPIIIHYHWMSDKNGFIQESKYDRVNLKIKQFNDHMGTKGGNSHSYILCDCRSFMPWFDVTGVVVSFLVAYFLRAASLIPSIQPFSFYIPFLIVAVIFYAFSFVLFRLYDRKRLLFSLSYLVDYLKALTLWGVLIIAFAFFTKTDYSRAVVTLFFVATACLVTLTRFLVVWKFPQHAEKIRDQEIHKAVHEMAKLSEASSDSLALLEGLRGRMAPAVFFETAKRVADIALSLAGLLTVGIFFPLVAFLIRKDSEGNALLAQKRTGKRGKNFVLYKFRTMYNKASLYAPAPRNGDDDRITKIGRFLRRYSIDELPQLWNVLRGDMSIVGPRPEMPFIVEKYEPWQKVRLEVKPGITGLWQILGRKDLPLEENLEYDFYYVIHRSFFLDLAIVIKTLPHLLFSRGAY